MAKRSVVRQAVDTDFGGEKLARWVVEKLYKSRNGHKEIRDE